MGYHKRLRQGVFVSVCPGVGGGVGGVSCMAGWAGIKIQLVPHKIHNVCVCARVHV